MAALSPIANASTMEVCHTHAAAIAEDGRLYQWGYTRNERIRTPLALLGLYTFRDFSCGAFNSLAVDFAGDLYGWGTNYEGTLGADQLTTRDLIVSPLPLLTHINKIEVSDFAVALREDGSVWMWGGPHYPWWLPDPDNATLDERATPVQVEGLDSVIDIAAPPFVGISRALVLALKDDGTVWSWGIDDPDPTLVEGLSNIIAIDTFEGHHVALRSDGSVWTWGLGHHGVLGTGEESGYRMAVARVPDLDEVVGVAAGINHMLALRNDGTIWGWGDNSNNELNTPDLEFSTYPIQIPGIEDAKEIAAGYFASLAKLNNGKIIAWGSNFGGLVDAYAYRPDLGEPTGSTGGTDLITPLGPHEIPGFGTTPTPPSGAPTAPWLSTETDGNRVTLAWGTEGVEPHENDRYHLVYAPYPSAAPASELFFLSQYRLEVDLPPGSAYYVLVYRDNVRDGIYRLGTTPFSNIEVVSVP